MRFKLNYSAGPSSFRCCFCLHVKTGTILIGLSSILFQVLALTAFTLFIVHPPEHQLQFPIDQIVSPEQNETDVFKNNDDPVDSNVIYQDGLDKRQDDPFRSYPWLNRKKWTSEDKFVGLLITASYFLISGMLVYGAAKERAGYLMPYFCVQVFEFSITCLSAIGYFSYMPNMRKWVSEQKMLPFKEELLRLDADWLMIAAVIFFSVVIVTKAYILGVVWACYKYLTDPAVNQIRQYTIPARDTEDTEMLLPPKYEDVVQMPEAQMQPPPYSGSPSSTQTPN